MLFYLFYFLLAFTQICHHSLDYVISEDILGK